ncbi:O-methylsterigmatocystin oxidoreductase [Diplogelasinospora grovesii]|uniref:O-methylsterigmatocystin oxidoreductase n=1 Tax=Diplogelasinospora grovesii TaxID=303347 RepID=A0AAN6NGK4_9PEZI|nr:O-methylsterigmatocystin oxidoreductase [Diplogelasinospora grovesii]
MAVLFSFYQLYKLAVLTLICAAASILLAWIKRDRRLDKMPGPRGWPLIGIGIGLPRKSVEVLGQWAIQYGEVYKIRVGWYNWVVINSPEAMRDIFDKQSVSTSSRSPMPLAHDVAVGGMRMNTLPYGKKWRAYRTIVHGLLSTTMTDQFNPSQEFETKQLLHDFAFNNGEDGRQFYWHVRRYFFSILMTSCYGSRVDSWEHEDVRSAIHSTQLLSKISKPGSFIVDEIPILAKLPAWLQPGRRFAESLREPILNAKLRLWRRLGDQMKDGRAPMCFGRQLAENDKSWRQQGLTDEDFAWIVGGIADAGSGTSTVTFNSAILYLAANPDVQDKAYEELMRVVGPDRTPTIRDLPDLPYINACVKETIRLKPVPVWCIKRYADADVRYKDYVIPKGTVLLGNTIFLGSDPAKYENPQAFMPERYLSFPRSSFEYAAGDQTKRDHFSFGVGRRVCPGAKLAEMTLDLALANILWALAIKPPKGSSNAALDAGPDAWDDTEFQAPKPFAVSFEPRRPEALDFVKKQWETSMEEGYELNGRRVDVKGVVSM